MCTSVFYLFVLFGVLRTLAGRLNGGSFDIRSMVREDTVSQVLVRGLCMIRVYTCFVFFSFFFSLSVELRFHVCLPIGSIIIVTR